MQGNNFKNNEKLDYKVCKNQPNFLKTLSKNGLTPKVLNFKLTNSNLFYSNTCKKCQFLLLKEEIKSRVSVSIRQRKEFKNVKASIKSKVSTFNFAHTLCLFVVGNDSKPCKLGRSIAKNFTTWDWRAHMTVTTLIKQFSTIPCIGCLILSKGLNYALPPIKFIYGDYMTPFKLFYHKIRKLPIED